MTEKEAVEILEEVKMLDDTLYAYSSTYMKALEVAIKVLEEVQKYREIDRDILQFLLGEWCEAEKVQNTLGMTFEQCFKVFDFSREAEWWSMVGKTEEERAREGQKITCCFRIKKKGEAE